MTTEYLQQGGLRCVSVWPDGAAAMTGSAKGFINRVRGVAVKESSVLDSMQGNGSRTS